VETCADCPGEPYACSPCELSAHCVADCEADCVDDVGCDGSGTCVPAGAECPAAPFCGCEPPSMPCWNGDRTSCVESCADCPGLPYNFFGVCDSGEYPGSCLDEEGPEFLCEAPEGWTCVDGCAECGPHFCVSGSCTGQFCESGDLPGYPFYTCREGYCCETGFLCQATSSCVASCAECAGTTAGACGVNGVCVADCDECFEDPAATIEVCDGVCADTSSDLWNCGECGSFCDGGFDHAECSEGHCCVGSFMDMPPWQWCDDCNCCLGMGFLCSPEACEYGCVGT